MKYFHVKFPGLSKGGQGLIALNLEGLRNVILDLIKSSYKFLNSNYFHNIIFVNSRNISDIAFAKLVIASVFLTAATTEITV